MPGVLDYRALVLGNDLWHGDCFHMEIGPRLTINGLNLADEVTYAWHVIRMSIRTAKLFRDLPSTHHLAPIKWYYILVVFGGSEVQIRLIKSHQVIRVQVSTGQ